LVYTIRRLTGTENENPSTNHRGGHSAGNSQQHRPQQARRPGAQFTIAIFRTQLFNAADMPNVRRVQAGYKVEPLSAFLHKPAPPAAPVIDFPKFTDDAFKMDFPKYLSFLCSSAPRYRKRRRCGQVCRDRYRPGQALRVRQALRRAEGRISVGIERGLRRD
jgi:hypothetical protein